MHFAYCAYVLRSFVGSWHTWKGGRTSDRDFREGRMSKDRNTVTVSYAMVALTAAGMSAVATWSATQLVAVSAAQPAPAAAGQLLTQPLADLPGREVRISVLDREPSASSARH